MASDMMHRGERLEELKQDMQKASNSWCSVENSSIKEGNRTTAQDAYGVYAITDLRKGEILLVDRTVAAVTSDEGSCQVCFRRLTANAVDLLCCNVKFCSTACAKEAKKSFHKAMCGKTFRFPGLSDLCLFRQTLNSLLLRCLAVIVQADIGSHPLYNSVVSTLTANRAGPRPWRYHDDIIYPIHMLQTLGIDVFADLRHDTWVIRTMYMRILNNMDGEEEGNGVRTKLLNRLYSMLNHSCHPNLDWTHQYDRRSSVMIRAKRDIKKGEELFISHVGEEGRFQPFAERQRRLITWFGADCGCARCKAERPGADEAEFARYWRGHLSACSSEDRSQNMLFLAATEQRRTVDW
ncbi:uncharacterized protein BDZ99DRAFT_463806 [Mytilinidion resinicola]|uniref:SET domain-containing protein n=1 Tax=Mytilinidion resinicola TaxID=574789 RepID=A0A6A6YLV0_9PEZI|nr:uncharacterized protein BDZ99DRAFT_463806 [Mytilinidion resinicola]KAF2808955.1 hypothetical protein BDZ99DRAFT_463806 [Mytilinidion resinicola]